MKPGAEKPSSTSRSQPSTPEVNPQSAEKDPYQTFLVEQQNRDVKWSANREASRVIKKTNVTSDETRDEISILKQQLQAKDRECALLRDQLRGQERLYKVNTSISNVSASKVLTRFNWFFSSHFFHPRDNSELILVLENADGNLFLCAYVKYIFTFFADDGKIRRFARSMEGNMAQRLSRIEKRLESLETMVSFLLL